ncbi:DUF7192 family protein [Streptomyces profundus]|uniref:DUF7192 family protein n=1 Tax=Streptomyces profundus TaxID=2867410 RepID=UPI001D16249A|nr:hypothetical protein [Streptomyces sp. MA3_2.13]UED86220.1 hypothetical protein K4G22_20160 [Streptomyces sp. MA3_2.13]
MRPATPVRLPPIWSWGEFLELAAGPTWLPDGHSRKKDDEWAGGGFAEALRLATDGWVRALPETDVSIATLRERTGQRVRTTVLEPRWDVTGSEVDIAAYLAGEPECMIDAVPQVTTTVGRVVTLLVPAVCAATTPNAYIQHRGLALAALCSAIVGAGHSVEVWSGWASNPGGERHLAVARVISPSEPLDLGRLIFAMAHPAMLRRLWFAVWDVQPEPIARTMVDANYGQLPFTCYPDDLPDGVENAYVLPYLDKTEDQWETLESALAWCQDMFVDLGLVRSG